MAVRPIRPCHACGQRDDHPRDVVAFINRPGAATRYYHLDCHARLGCQSCADAVTASGGATGEALLAHLAAVRAARSLED